MHLAHKVASQLGGIATGSVQQVLNTLRVRVVKYLSGGWQLEGNSMIVSSCQGEGLPVELVRRRAVQPADSMRVGCDMPKRAGAVKSLC